RNIRRRSPRCGSAIVSPLSGHSPRAKASWKRNPTAQLHAKSRASIRPCSNTARKQVDMSASQNVNKLKQAMQSMAATTVQERPQSEPQRANPTQHSRRGKRAVTFYVQDAAQKQLRLLSIEVEKSSQALLEQALNDLFRKHN